jgi:hypothetical protein
VRAQVLHELVAHGRRVREQVASLVALTILDGLEDLRLFLRAHAGHLADAPGARGLGQGGEAGHAQRRVQPRHGLGPHALQPQELQHGGRKLLELRLVIAGSAGVGQFPDARRQVLPMPGSARSCGRSCGRRRRRSSPRRRRRNDTRGS